MLNGLQEILPEQLQKRQVVIQKISEVFEQDACVQITTPTFEVYDVIKRGWGDFFKEHSLQFFNADGTHMVLRPEMTSSIARLLASHKSQIELPLSVYYIENVFRKSHISRRQEVTQVGVEVIGQQSPQAEFKCLKMLLNMFVRLGIDQVKIEVNDTEVIKTYSDEEYQALCAGRYDLLKKLPRIGSYEVLPKTSNVRKLVQSLIEEVPEYGKFVQVNTGLVKELSYYTGLIFNVYVEGIGQPVGTGGRYDGLYAKYGWDVPAVGFALEFEELWSYLKKREAL